MSPAPAGVLAVGTLNLYRLFDDERDRNERDIPSTREFRARIARIARYIVHDMGAPPILGVQEVEDDTALRALVAALGEETGREWRFIQGGVAGDGDIRSALLYDTRVKALGSQSLFDRSTHAKMPLHDRLPLVVDIDARTLVPSLPPLRLVVVHLKSMSGMDRRGPDGERVREKRRFQATELRDWLRAEASSGGALIVLGDFNATTGPEGDPRAEPMGILSAGGTVVSPASRFLKPSQRWTYRYHCQLNELDHLLVSAPLAPRVAGYAIARGDTCLRAREKCDTSRSVSDHEGVVLRLK